MWPILLMYKAGSVTVLYIGLHKILFVPRAIVWLVLRFVFINSYATLKLLPSAVVDFIADRPNISHLLNVVNFQIALRTSRARVVV